MPTAIYRGLINLPMYPTSVTAGGSGGDLYSQDAVWWDDAGALGWRSGPAIQWVAGNSSFVVTPATMRFMGVNANNQVGQSIYNIQAVGSAFDSLNIPIVFGKNLFAYAGPYDDANPARTAINYILQQFSPTYMNDTNTVAALTLSQTVPYTPLGGWPVAAGFPVAPRRQAPQVVALAPKLAALFMFGFSAFRAGSTAAVWSPLFAAQGYVSPIFGVLGNLITIQENTSNLIAPDFDTGINYVFGIDNSGVLPMYQSFVLNPSGNSSILETFQQIFWTGGPIPTATTDFKLTPYGWTLPANGGQTGFFLMDRSCRNYWFIQFQPVGTPDTALNNHPTLDENGIVYTRTATGPVWSSFPPGGGSVSPITQTGLTSQKASLTSSPAFDFEIWYDNYIIPGINPTAPVSLVRTQTDWDLDPTPGADTTTCHRNIGVVLEWLAEDQLVLFETQPSFFLTPEDTIDRPTDWMDGGTMHYKFVQGVRIEADTGGVNRTVQIQYDGGIVATTLTINQSGDLILPYTFSPFKARLMRLVPTDANSWRLFRVEWVYDIEPEPVNFWVTQTTSFGLKGYGHIRDMQIAYASVNGGITLIAIVDGVSHTLASNLPATAGLEIKQYLNAPAIKGKIWQLLLTGTGVQIYGKDCEFRVKSWGDQGYNVLKPIGDESVVTGGAII